MNLKITKNLHMNNYSVTFEIIDITSIDKSKIEDYGLIKISIGGEIPLPDGTSFHQEEELKILPHEFPFTRTFMDAQNNGQGELYANAYAEEIKKRVEATITTLKAKVDNFSGVEVYPI